MADRVNPALFEAQTPQQVIESREASHGDYRLQAAVAQEIKNLLRTGVGWHQLSASEKESLDMVAVKISRILNGTKPDADHWLDIAGYATLCYNQITTGSSLGQSGETK